MGRDPHFFPPNPRALYEISGALILVQSWLLGQKIIITWSTMGRRNVEVMRMRRWCHFTSCALVDIKHSESLVTSARKQLACCRKLKIPLVTWFQWRIHTLDGTISSTIFSFSMLCSRQAMHIGGVNILRSHEGAIYFERVKTWWSYQYVWGSLSVKYMLATQNVAWSWVQYILTVTIRSSSIPSIRNVRAGSTLSTAVVST